MFIYIIIMLTSVIVVILLITESNLSRCISDRHMFLHFVCSTSEVSQTCVPKHRSPILLAVATVLRLQVVWMYHNLTLLYSLLLHL